MTDRDLILDIINSSRNFTLMDESENVILLTRKNKSPLRIEKKTVISDDYNLRLKFKFESLDIINESTLYFYDKNGYILVVYGF